MPSKRFTLHPHRLGSDVWPGYGGRRDRYSLSLVHEPGETCETGVELELPVHIDGEKYLEFYASYETSVALGVWILQRMIHAGTAPLPPAEQVRMRAHLRGLLTMVETGLMARPGSPEPEAAPDEACAGACAPTGAAASS